MTARAGAELTCFRVKLRDELGKFEPIIAASTPDEAIRRGLDIAVEIRPGRLRVEGFELQHEPLYHRFDDPIVSHDMRESGRSVRSQMIARARIRAELTGRA